jgi:hypothetical protein
MYQTFSFVIRNSKENKMRSISSLGLACVAMIAVFVCALTANVAHAGNGSVVADVQLQPCVGPNCNASLSQVIQQQAQLQNAQHHFVSHGGFGAANVVKRQVVVQAVPVQQHVVRQQFVAPQRVIVQNVPVHRQQVIVQNVPVHQQRVLVQSHGFGVQANNVRVRSVERVRVSRFPRLFR